QHCGPAHSFRAGWYYTAARAEVDRGRTAEARDWTRRAVEAAGAVGLRGQHAYAAMARACTGPADGETVVELLRTAVREFTAGSGLIAAGHARLELARALITVGGTDEAARHVETVKQFAATCGAGHLHTLAVNVQRRLGALGPRAAGRGGSSTDLSSRERVIATLVGQGMSNRDIAQATFLSVKTVESYLTRIFRKLGVDSRVKLARKLAATPPDDTPWQLYRDPK
ncbi:helix-turn-helix transcriptional regulator, partial [Dactylosporangium darangshiense]